jgi:hypothetical protein
VFFQNSAGTEYARFNSSGNLGIGISSPSFPLTVLSPSVTSIAIAVNGRSSDNSGVLSFYANDGSTQYATITGTAAEFRLSSVPAAAVQTFYTNSSERMRIDASGNVGIGTSSINGRLNLAVGASTACTLRFTSNGTGAGSGDRGRLDFYSADNSGTAYQLGYMDYDRADGTGTASYIAFANRVSGTVAERMRIDSSGNLLVAGTGTTPVQSNTAGAFSYRPAAQLEINGNATQAAFFGRTNDGMIVGFYSGGTRRGSVDIAGATTSYVTSSDYRLKENIAPMTGALTTVSQLKPVTYKWKEDGKSGQGFIAHELQAVVSDCVTGEKDAVDADGNPQYQGVDTSFLVATLTAAIQELKVIVDAQAVEIAALKAK